MGHVCTKEVKRNYKAVLCAYLRFFCLEFKVDKIGGLLKVEQMEELLEWVRDLKVGERRKIKQFVGLEMNTEALVQVGHVMYY